MSIKVVEFDQEHPKPIEDYVATNGYHYHLVDRNDDWVMYAQHHRKDDNLPIAYEVFKVKVRSPRLLGDVYYPHRETFPASSDWGTNAWTFRSKERAYKVLREKQNKH